MGCACLRPLRLVAQVLSLTVERAEEDVETVALGRDKGHLLIGVSEVGRDQGARVGSTTAGGPRTGGTSTGVGSGGDGTGEQTVKVGAGAVAAVAGPPRCGHAKPREQRLGVALGGLGRRRGLLRGREAEDLCLELLDGELEVGDAGGGQALVGARDKVVNLGLVLLEPRVDLVLVYAPGALCLGEDEVEEEEEAEVAVEGDPF